ncbi:SDR family oxidoreductase [Mycobacterium sp. NAZ190054]|uniref:SDR family oxidoreductase n=1 Tax=Mycobacterium sp. NAZ190054 TaxID=1747766 RepID=UPI000792FB8A|nr:SDR family NAD(P)-dependent oxidoreductase [Mycobacterium sp. NAZ190054]KWX68519.1 oxidoreductase [Mycobacterium sp. NAZ190054]
MNITGNTIFIPGATSGIGLALATALSAKGNKVIIGGRRTDKLDEITGAYPQIKAVPIDIADPHSVTTAAAEVLQRCPDLNVVIAMAGVMRVEDWHHPESFLDSAQQVVNTNLLGPIRLLGAFLEHLQTRPDATFVTVSSGLAFVPLKVVPSYNASKAAVHMLTESLRLQLADTSITFLELVPPSVATDLLPGQRDSDIAMPVEDFVDEVLTIIERQPEAHEILVDRVKTLRYAEAHGDYQRVVADLNASDPHARP